MSNGNNPGNPPPGSNPGTVSISATDDRSAQTGFSFQSPVTVKAGTKVNWVNNSSAPHCIMWDAQVPASSPAPGANIGVFNPGATSASWAAPMVSVSTTYNYHCCIHGPGMAGVIVVTP